MLGEGAMLEPPEPQRGERKVSPQSSEEVERQIEEAAEASPGLVDMVCEYYFSHPEGIWLSLPDSKVTSRLARHVAHRLSGDDFETAVGEAMLNAHTHSVSKNGYPIRIGISIRPGPDNRQITIEIANPADTTAEAIAEKRSEEMEETTSLFRGEQAAWQALLERADSPSGEHAGRGHRLISALTDEVISDSVGLGGDPTIITSMTYPKASKLAKTDDIEATARAA